MRINVRAGLNALRENIPCAAFLIAVIVFQLYLYFTYPGKPIDGAARNGWELWWDQSQYLASATALASFNFSESQHWYPLGYSLLGVPLVRVVRDPFFFPNLLSMIVFAWTFQRYFRPLIGMFGVALAFFGALVLPLVTKIPFEVQHLLWLQFVVPWNTIPVAAMFMSLICLLHELEQPAPTSRHLLIGVLVGVIVAIKPVEALPLTVAGLWYCAKTLQDRSTALRRISTTVVGAVATAGPVFALGIYIHHGLSSPYTEVIRQIGMSASDLPQRAIDLFVDAGPSFGEPNTALFGLLPWFPILAPLAVVGAVLRPRELLLPVAMVCVSYVTYLSYNDFIPKSLLHFFLIHYIVWTFPVVAGAGLYMLVCIVRRPRWAIPSVAAVLIVCAIGALRIRLVPSAHLRDVSRAVNDGRVFELSFTVPTHVDAIDLPPSLILRQHSLYGNPLRVEVDAEPLDLFSGYRLIDFGDRWRLMFTRPINATRISFWAPDLDENQVMNIRPMRFALHFESSPWAPHSAETDLMYWLRR